LVGEDLKNENQFLHQIGSKRKERGDVRLKIYDLKLENNKI